MAKYKSKVVCKTPSTYALTVEVVNGTQSLKFNPYMQGAIGNIIEGFKKEFLDNILRITDGVGADSFQIAPQYNREKTIITIHSKCDKGARPIVEDLDWYLFPRLQCVLASNGCELTK